MPREKATDKLSDEAQRVMLQGFAGSRTAAWIAQAVLDATGEVVATRTVARRAAEWRAEVRRRTSARERMEDLVAALRNGNTDASEMIQALAMQALTDDPDALTAENPVRVQKLSLQAEELRLKRRQIEVRERTVAVSEKKLSLLEAREQRLRAAVEGAAKKSLTPEETLREVRSILCLKETPDAA